MKIVDASAMIQTLLGTPRGERVDDEIGEDACSAPDLICVEITSGLARLVRAEVIDAADAGLAVDAFGRNELELLPHRDMVGPAWSLRDRVRISDAFYVVAAKQLDAPIITCDGRLARAPLPGIRINLIS